MVFEAGQAAGQWRGDQLGSLAASWAVGFLGQGGDWSGLARPGLARLPGCQVWPGQATPGQAASF